MEGALLFLKQKSPATRRALLYLFITLSLYLLLSLFFARTLLVFILVRKQLVQIVIFLPSIVLVCKFNFWRLMVLMLE